MISILLNYFVFIYFCSKLYYSIFFQSTFTIIFFYYSFIGNTPTSSIYLHLFLLSGLARHSFDDNTETQKYRPTYWLSASCVIGWVKWSMRRFKKGETSESTKYYNRKHFCLELKQFLGSYNIDIPYINMNHTNKFAFDCLSVRGSVCASQIR